jgi:hypothetical protein
MIKINWPRDSKPTIGDWLLWAFIAYAVIGTIVGLVYGIFFSSPVCCDDITPMEFIR